MHQAALLASITTLHLALTALPGVAAVLVAAHAGIRDLAVLLSVGLIGCGLAALLAFWSYFAAPMIGEVCAYVTVAVSLLLWFRYRRALGPDRQMIKRLLTPVALWGLAAAFLVFLGFLRGDINQPMATAMTRFSHPLTGDNYLPLFFADAIFVNGHKGPPAHAADWLSSDRPPLQSGFVLAQRVFEWNDRVLHYQVLGVILQQLWIVGLWSFLVAARVRAASRALVVIALLLSDVVIVNGFFVWPKLLSATYLLAAAAFVLTDEWPTARRDLRSALIVSALFAFALLSHGGSIFGIAAFILVAAVRGMPTSRWVVAGLAVGFLLFGPWLLYQRYEDPPGNRLIKWLLAGVALPDERTSFQALKDSYSAVGIGGAVWSKVGNFRTMAGGQHAVAHMVDAAKFAVSGNFAETIRLVRADRFFGFLQSLGIFVFAPLVMLALRTRGRQSSQDWTFALRCLGCAVVGCLAWGLLIFGAPGPAPVMHAGSYALAILAFAGCAVGLWVVAPKLALWAVIFHSLTALMLYVPVLDPMPGTEYSLVGAVAALVILACFAVVAVRSGHEETDIRPTRLGALSMSAKFTPTVRNTVLLTFALAMLMFLRRPDSLLNAQFWAEDGSVFFHDQLRFGFIQALSTPYAGYFQPLQRTVAALSSWLHVDDIPFVYNLCAIIIDAACCATFFVPRYRALISSDSLRLSLCILAATAVDSRELVGIVANSVWFVTLLGVVLVARPPEPRTRLTRSIVLLFAFILGLSAPILIIVAPIASFRLLRGRREFSTAFTAAIALGALSQVFGALFLGPFGPPGSVTPDSLMFTVLQTSTYKVVLQSLIGFPATMAVAQTQMFGTVLVALIAIIAFLTWMLTVLEATDRRRAIVAAYIICASVAVPLATRGFIVHDLSEFMIGGPCYFYVASCVFMYLVALAIERKLPLPYERWKSVLLIAVFAGGIYGNFRIDGFVDLNWRYHAANIRLWMRYRQFGDIRVPSVTVPINPPGWRVELPAREPNP